MPKTNLNIAQILTPGKIQWYPSGSNYQPTSSAPATSAQFDIQVNSLVSGDWISNSVLNPYIIIPIMSSSYTGTNYDLELVIRFFTSSHFLNYHTGSNFIDGGGVNVLPISSSLYYTGSISSIYRDILLSPTASGAGTSLLLRNTIHDAIVGSSIYNSGMISASKQGNLTSSIFLTNVRGKVNLPTSFTGSIATGRGVNINTISTGSGTINFFEQYVLSENSASLSIEFDENDPTSLILKSPTSSLNSGRSNSTLMYFSSSGHVGIGTKTPKADLEVTGSIQADKIITKAKEGRPIVISDSEIKFYETTQIDPEHGDYQENKEKARIKAVPGSFNLVFEVSGSSGYTNSVYISQSGKIGFNTDDPQTGFDAVVEEAQFQQPGSRKGLKINNEGNIESFNKDIDSATTGSEFILRYSRGTTINAESMNALFGEGNFGDEEAVDYFNSLRSEEQSSILEQLESLGFNTLPNVGDTIGSIRFIAESGSVAGFSDRTTGEAASISSKVHSADATGVRGDLIFSVADQTGTSVQRMVIDAGDVHQLSGSLNIGGATSAAGALNIKGPSGNNQINLNRYGGSSYDQKVGKIDIHDDGNVKVRFSAKGQSYITATNDGTHTTGARLGIGTTDPKVELEVIGDISASGNLIVTNITASDMQLKGTIYDVTLPGSYYINPSGASRVNGLNLAGTLTAGVANLTTVTSTNITASNNISASGTIIAPTINATNYFDSTSTYHLLTVDGTTLRIGQDSITSNISAVPLNVLGHITASGNISSSGDITLDSTLNFGATTGEIKTTNANGSGNININPDGALKLGSAGTDHVYIGRQDNTNYTTRIFGGNSTENIKTGLNYVQLNVPVTASGNISASGTITANSFVGAFTGGVTGDATGLTGVPDITVGTITAREFHTEFVSASIMFESGSTKFGDTDDDVHQFTGSVHIQTSGSAGNNKFKLTTSAGNDVVTMMNANSDTFPVGSISVGYGSTTAGQIVGNSNTLKIRGGSSTSGKILFTNGSGGADELAEISSDGLTVTGNISASGTGSFSDGRFTGKVGIGTTSPTGELHVSNTSDFYTDLDGTDSAVVFKEGGGNPWRIGNKDSDDSFRISQDASSLNTNTRLTIANGGNVGIGTTTPTEALQVTGDISASGDVHLADLQFKTFYGAVRFGTGGTANTFKYNEWKQSATGGTTIHNTAGAINLNSGGHLVTVNNGNVTASGNISASGQFLGANFGLDSTDKLQFSDGTLQFRLNDASRITHTSTIFRPTSDEGVSLGRSAEKWKELVVNHITASGNISASGDVFGQKFGNDLRNHFDFSTDNQLHYKVNNVNKLLFNQSRLAPAADLGTALGASNLRWNELNVNHITASGNISSSGKLYGTDLYLGNKEFADYHGPSDTFRVAATGEPVHIFANVTASGNISSSGTITANSFVGAFTGAVTGDATGLTGTPDIIVGSLTATSITSSIVTSSIIYTEGSNIFGDAISDTHTFNGHITASGNISASGNIIADHIKSFDAYALELDPGSAGPRILFGAVTDTDTFMSLGAYGGKNNINTTTRDFHLYGTNTTTGFYFDESAGKFGIGTATPDELFDVAGTARFETGIAEGTIYVGNNIQHWGDGGTGVYFDTDEVQIQTDGGKERLKISNTSISASSNVYITGSTINPLHVRNNDAAGDNGYSLIKVENGFGNAEFGTVSNYARIRAAGNEIFAGNYGATYFYNNGKTSLTMNSNGVGAGTAAPAAKLHIAGNVWASGSTATGAGHVTASGNISASGTGSFGEINLDDNKKLNFGTGNDLSIYHDGSNSYVKDAGQGSLYTLTDAYRLTNAAGTENMIWAAEDSFVKLYYNNSAKLETVNVGVEITGELQADTLNIDGNADISGNITTATWAGAIIPEAKLENQSGTNTGDNAANTTYSNVTNESKATMFTSPTFTGNVTASGNISASGTITANSFVGAFTGAVTGNATGLTGTPDISVRHITASGNISASGAIDGASLDINGAADIAGTLTVGTTAGSNINMLRTSANYINTTNTTGYLVFRTGGYDNALTLDASQNSTFAGEIKMALSATTQRALSSTGTDSIQIGDAGVNDIIFKNAAGSVARILANGNVGIGTTSPSAKLHVDGDAIITGTITAQEFHTEFVSASIMFSSGSTKFGDTNDDIHQFTGSLNLTGSLDINNTAGSTAQAIFRGGSSLNSDYRSGQILIGGSNNLRGSLAWNNNLAGVFLDNQYDSTVGFIAFRTRTSGTPVEGMRILGGGNVGIGTSFPTEKLQVEGNISASGTLNVSTFASIQDVDTGNPTPAADETRVSGYGIIGNRSAYYITNANAGSLIFGVGGTHSAATKMTILDSGNVGIGTTTPTEALTVTGDISASLDIHAQRNINMGLKTDDPIFSLYNNQNLNKIYTSHSASVNNAQLTIQGGNYTHAVNFKDSYSNQDNYATLSGGYINDSKLILFNSSSQLTTTLSTATSSFNYLNVTNKVGIGTTSPGFNLDIYEDTSETLPMIKLRQDGVGDASIGFNIIGSTQVSVGLDNSDGDKFKISRSEALGSSTQLTIDSSGNVGIGTDTPAHQLHISGASARLLVEKSANDVIIEAKSVTAGAWFYANSYTSQGYAGLQLQGGGVDKWFIGQYGTNDFHITDGTKSGGTKHFTIKDTTGNIGIGNITPTEKLTVVGDISASGDININNNSSYKGKHINGTEYGLLTLTNGNVVKVGAYDYTSASTVFGGGNNTQFLIGSSEVMRMRSTGLEVTGQITASGNISASGTITANSFVGAFTGAVTGNATGLTGTPNISVGHITASGNISGSSTSTLTMGGAATIGGTVQASSYKIGGATVLAGSGAVTIGSSGATGTISLTTHTSTPFKIENDDSISITSDTTITGALRATTKSFVIDTPEGGKLEYGSLEGRQHDVFHKGKCNNNVIELPKEWEWLIDNTTLTVQLTAIGKHQNLYVKEIKNNKVYISAGMFKTPNCYFLIHASRKDTKQIEHDN
jgi:ethanolamine utilization microcompartment shell protein EutS